MNNEELIKLLKEYTFIKLKNSEVYYVTTSVVLDGTSNTLNIYAYIKNNKIIFTDNHQLLDCYCIFDKEYKRAIETKIKPNLNKENFYIEDNAIKMKVEEIRLPLDISDFIKTIVVLENVMNNI